MSFIIPDIHMVPTIQRVDNVPTLKLTDNPRHILVLVDSHATTLATEARYPTVIQRSGEGRLDLRIVTVQEVVDPANGSEGVPGRQLLGRCDGHGQEVHDMNAGCGVEWLDLVSRHLSVA